MGTGIAPAESLHGGNNGVMGFFTFTDLPAIRLPTLLNDLNPGRGKPGRQVGAQWRVGLFFQDDFKWSHLNLGIRWVRSANRRVTASPTQPGDRSFAGGTERQQPRRITRTISNSSRASVA
jgi:hypothetical protein